MILVITGALIGFLIGQWLIRRSLLTSDNRKKKR